MAGGKVERKDCKGRKPHIQRCKYMECVREMENTFVTTQKMIWQDYNFIKMAIGLERPLTYRPIFGS